MKRQTLYKTIHKKHKKTQFSKVYKLNFIKNQVNIDNCKISIKIKIKKMNKYSNNYKTRLSILAK